MGRALRSLLLLATLSLWLSSAGAFCVSEVAYNYVMRGDDPTPEQTLPCCSAAGQVTLAAQKDSSSDAHRDAAAGGAVPRFEARATRLPGAWRSPLRWRPYCERSARLLQ